MRLHRHLLPLAALALPIFARLQAAEDFGKAQPFKSGDTVCFVGDSITHGGSYHSIVTLYYATRFPDRPLTTINCGISGDRASGIMSDEKFRLNVDILAHKPTAATIMLGMNDVGRTDYLAPQKDAPDAAQKQKHSLEVYDESMQKLIASLQKIGAQITLITPSIYDETTTLATASKDNAIGVNGALGQCAAKGHAWSKQYGTGTANFYETMNAINEREQKKDPTFTVVGPDRIHPGPVGHFVMAYTLLKAQGVPSTVATIGIDAKKGKASGEKNCTILDLKAGPTNVNFDCKEAALPLVVHDSAKAALKLVPFTNDLNREDLIIAGLAPGKYTVSIDDTPIGEYSAEELKAGVNLAENAKTPQYAQSAAATKINQDRTSVGAQLRSLAALYYGMSRSGIASTDFEAIEKKLTERVEASKKDGQPADPKAVGNLELFKKRDQLNADLAKHTEALRAACVPKSHRFKITQAAK